MWSWNLLKDPESKNALRPTAIGRTKNCQNLKEISEKKFEKKKNKLHRFILWSEIEIAIHKHAKKTNEIKKFAFRKNDR